MRNLLAAFACLAASAPAQAKIVDLGSLLRDMLDRDRLARLAEPPFRCAQASSYDRDSVAPDQPGWFANDDRSEFMRTEINDGRREHVMLDVDGPGAIVRFWATWDGARGRPFSDGTLRVYLDGEPAPAIAGPIASVISGGALAQAPLSSSVSPLSDYARRGHNLYLPIPYARHCKITYATDAPLDRGAREGGEALYYQINYRTYTAGTAVRSFASTQLEPLQPLLAEVCAALQVGDGADSTQHRDLAGTLAAGDARSIELEGPGAVRELVLRLDAADRPQALRSTVLEISCDGERTVWCPLEAFFGCGYLLHPHATRHVRADADGELTSRWVMPFARSCTITVRNLGPQEVRLQTGSVRHGPWEWDARSLHFHGCWRRYAAVDTRGGRESNAFDVNYVTVAGRGHYVGDTLTVFNASDAWWGEGDERIFVDDESFPSHFGTGTEDYYGYAWCRDEPFSDAFHSQPTGAGNMRPGFSVNSRYRILDVIPFERSLRFDMELWHWVDTKIDFAPACFWYARPGATSNVAPDADAARAPVTVSREQLVPALHVDGALEGEAMSVLAKPAGVTEIQDVPKFRWSNDRQLWWRDAKVGDRLQLGFEVAAAGTYRVRAELTKANDYGIVQLAINDAPAGPALDCFHPDVIHDLIDLGEHELGAGANTLTVTITGANDKAIKAHMFGLDYLLLEKVR